MSLVRRSTNPGGRSTSTGAVEAFEELRRILLEPEQEQLQALHERLEDENRRTREVSGVLPQAAALSAERGEELSRALRPVVGKALRETIEKEPQGFVDVLHPIIGAVVRRSIAESFRRLLQSLNQSLENTFSLKGLQWRLEARRTGRSFAEVVLLRSLVYRVEQIFLIHRETGLLLLQVEDETSTAHDPDMVASMLSAIQDFSRDSFQAEDNAALEEFRVGELEVWIEPGPKAGLAAVIRGTPPRELRTTLGEALARVHNQQGAALAEFKGDASVFEPLRPELEACLRAQYQQGEAAEQSMARAWFTLGAAAGLIFAVFGFFYMAERRWDDFLHRLRAEPGLAVTAERRGWFRGGEVAGLRDLLAADPAPLARQAGLDPARIRFVWKDYLALDATSILRRVEQRFGTPAGARFTLAPGGVLEVAGQAPYEWIERLRREYPQAAGVSALNEEHLQATYDPALVLQRFEKSFPPPAGVTARMQDGALHLAGKASPEWIARVREGAAHLPGIATLDDRELQPVFEPAFILRRFKDLFGQPETVNAAVRDGVLTLSGEAPHTWLLRVREGAASLPGVSALDERQLTDLDLAAFQHSKTIIENTFIYFPSGRVDFDTTGLVTLSRLSDEIRRAEAAARRLNAGISIEVLGSADAAGAQDKNLELSARRAETVRDFLVSCGLPAERFTASAVPAPASPDAATQENDRRVAFRVALQP